MMIQNKIQFISYLLLCVVVGCGGGGSSQKIHNSDDSSLGTGTHANRLSILEELKPTMASSKYTKLLPDVIEIMSGKVQSGDLKGIQALNASFLQSKLFDVYKQALDPLLYDHSVKRIADIVKKNMEGKSGAELFIPNNMRYYYVGQYVLCRNSLADKSADEILNLFGSSIYQEIYSRRDSDGNPILSRAATVDILRSLSNALIYLRQSTKLSIIKKLIEADSQKGTSLFTKMWCSIFDINFRTITNQDLSIDDKFNIMPQDLVNYSMEYDDDADGSFLNVITIKTLTDNRIRIVKNANGEYTINLGKDNNKINKVIRRDYHRYHLLALAGLIADVKKVFRNIVDEYINYRYDNVDNGPAAGDWGDLPLFIMSAFDYKSGTPKCRAPRIYCTEKDLKAIPIDKIVPEYSVNVAEYRQIWNEENEYIWGVNEYRRDELFRMLNYYQKKEVLKMMMPYYKMAIKEIEKAKHKPEDMPFWVRTMPDLSEENMKSIVLNIMKAFSAEEIVDVKSDPDLKELVDLVY